jgi:hypothetical protein
MPALMLQYVVKIILTAAVVGAVAEIAKRSIFWGAAIASLPLTSVLAIVWLYLAGAGTERVAELSHSIFWLVLPSLTLFLVLPLLLRFGLGFWLALSISCVTTAAAYFAIVWSLGRLGVRV